LGGDFGQAIHSRTSRPVQWADSWGGSAIAQWRLI
jgi:hypothetical protein